MQMKHVQQGALHQNMTYLRESKEPCAVTPLCGASIAVTESHVVLHDQVPLPANAT